MNYYFPGFVDTLKAYAEPTPELRFVVNSGQNGLRLLIRNLSLEQKSKIAVPAFVCSATTEAVKKEGFQPVPFDLYPKSYWTRYDEKFILDNNIRAIVLVHLYGFQHPDTVQLTDFCLSNKISLIHDAAQTYGLDEHLLLRGNGVVYSFGPGKTLTGAGGGWVKGIDEKFYNANCSKPASDSISKQFLASRIYGYRPRLFGKIRSKFFSPALSDRILKMSKYALGVNAYVLSKLTSVKIKRKKNYDILRTVLWDSKKLSIPYDDGKGQYFKLVLAVNSDPDTFKRHLDKNTVPYFCQGDSLPELLSLENYTKWRKHFVEISTEASLPLKEIERVAGVLKSFD
jgi:dTDP-4-amino-4,6-dideoxygalactose transaminase